MLQSKVTGRELVVLHGVRRWALLCVFSGFGFSCALPVVTPRGNSGQEHARDSVDGDAGNMREQPAVSSDDADAGNASPISESRPPQAADCPDGDCTCFSPLRNLDRVSDASAHGCPCGEGGGYCTREVSLACIQGTWTSVIDGPCAPRGDACTAVVATSGECIERFGVCVMMPDGRFCARFPGM